MENKNTIITRFWRKHVGRYNISQSYITICNIFATHMIITMALFIWCLILTILIVLK
jgi:hypothetical protein